MGIGGGEARCERGWGRSGDPARRPRRSRRPCGRRAGPGGFGLLEVIVALAVLGVALTGIVQSLGHGVGVAGAAHRSMLARQIARAAAVGLPEDAAGALAAAGGAGWEEVAVEGELLRCRRRSRSWPEGDRAWLWIEAECRLEGEPDGAAEASGPAPGRAALLVAR